MTEALGSGTNSGRRSRLLAEARALIGTMFNVYSGSGESYPPVALNCSGFVILVCRRVGIGEGYLDPGIGLSTAGRIFKHLKETENPNPGDLAFYHRPDTHGGLEWHVMMVTESGVIGACPIAGRVREYPSTSFSEHWHAAGFREIPLL